MPYTLAHPAFAAPFRLLGFPLAALAAGSIAPDVPLWAEAIGVDGPLRAIGVDYAFTHAPAGVFSACLIAGVLLWLLWTLLRAPVLDAVPAVVRGRIPVVWLTSELRAVQPSSTPRLRERVGGFVHLGLAIVIGAASHVLLDEFTHEGRFAHTHLAWFRDVHAGLPGVKWVQYVGGVVGLAAVVVWLVVRLRRPSGHEAASTRDSRQTDLGRVLVRVGTALGAAAALVVTGATAVGAGLAAAVFSGATVGVLLVLSGVTLGAIGWHLAAGRRRRSRA